MALKYHYSLVALLLCGCGVDSDFSNEDSQTLFTEANGELHALHQETLALPEWPATYSRMCADGGTIEMATTTRADDSIADLDHTFVDCAFNGRTISGNLDYRNVLSEDCGGSQGFSFDIRGDLQVAGEAGGQCVMEAREVCGEFTGTTCGHEI